MMHFKEFLNEKVTGNYLYHLVDLDKMKLFLKDDFFGPGETSLTRNKNIDSIGHMSSKYFQFVFDKDKLKTRYKITPYADVSYKKKGFDDDEAEERISNFKNISKYIVEINFLRYDIILQTVDDFKSILKETNKHKIDYDDVKWTVNNYLEKIRDIIKEIKKSYKFNVIINKRKTSDNELIKLIDEGIKLGNEILSNESVWIVVNDQRKRYYKSSKRSRDWII